MTYKECIENKKKRWIGKKVKYKGGFYKVIDVDYNGFLLINKKTRFTDDMAVPEQSVSLVTENESENV